jgi:hypothetical protein
MHSITRRDEMGGEGWSEKTEGEAGGSITPT